MIEDLYIKATHDIPDSEYTPIPDTARITHHQGQWFCVPHPEYLALPWYKKLWRRCRWRYWGWKNRNVEWKHVMPNWDGPRRVYFNIDGRWSVLELEKNDE